METAETTIRMNCRVNSQQQQQQQQLYLHLFIQL